MCTALQGLSVEQHVQALRQNRDYDEVAQQDHRNPEARFSRLIQAGGRDGHRRKGQGHNA